MKTTDLVKTLEVCRRALYSAEDLRKLLGTGNDNTFYKTLERALKAGFLVRLSKGKYATWARRPETFELANFLYAPSYVSLESALNFHGILIQTPYRVSSVTPLRGRTIAVSGQEFAYVHLSHELYYGFVRKGTFVIATKEKALLDTLYLASKGLRAIERSDLDLSDLDQAKLLSMAKRTGKEKLIAFAKGFLK